MLDRPNIAAGDLVKCFNPEGEHVINAVLTGEWDVGIDRRVKFSLYRLVRNHRKWMGTSGNSSWPTVSGYRIEHYPPGPEYDAIWADYCLHFMTGDAEI